MTKNNLWPASLEIPLLRAAFLSNEAGIQAWQLWRSQVNMEEHPDLGAFRLLPAVYHNLQSLDIDDSMMMKLKGIARRNWYQNQRFFRSVAPPLQALHEVGFKCMLLGGPAIVLRYYSEYALGSEAALAILVPATQARQTFEQLQLLGWQPEKPLPDTLIESYLAAGRMHSFRDATGRGIQLYWHLLPECLSTQADADFWAGAVKTKLHDVPVYIPNPADQILHICAENVITINSYPFLRTIDIMFIYMANPDLDWGRLLSYAEKFHLVMPVLKVLSYFQNNLDEPLPPAIWQQFLSLSTSQRDRLEYRLKTSRIPLWRRFWQIWFDYQRRTSSTSLWQDILGFPQYLQHYWRLSEPRHVFNQGLFVILQYLRRAFQKLGFMKSSGGKR